ncbi:hypothetical protein M409DRAFT_25145 [Zasmidium cellare ATCC 36951]|uniref:Heterokaryon incompatibility domain-containing protein n=1 Tax=Zasmidium cellare ATCC 36951 TaxID=1080233 RepID=A0A6A6CCI6_ZASCE|nr:uncharacterized protein M409DRAFT_25145 [Zasmidium cellare ATCC 36951]KAF2164751.1 hypothetical protein M409DRAFT_25145 [Zasmidium cellare ATCC 36951]
MDISNNSITSKYKPLPKGKHIRVLHILEAAPVSSDSQLLIELTELDIEDDSADWDCLSYTWGPPISTPESFERYGTANDVVIMLRVGEHEYRHTIGRNLYEALQQLENMNHRRPLWIAAICINQDDPAEKSRQVSMMDDLFSRTKRVYVWMGVDDPEAPAFNDIVWLRTVLVNKIRDYEKINEDITYRDFPPVKMEGIDGLHSFKINTTISWTRVRALFNFYTYRRYLSRAWMVQELCLAKNEPLILLGEHTITLDSMCQLQETFAGHPTMPYLTHKEPDGNAGMGFEITWIARMRAKLHQLDIGGDHEQRSKLLMDDLCGVKRGAKITPKTVHCAVWEELLCTLHQRRSSDPRDLIYSLIGLANRFSGASHPQDFIRPDYTSDVEKVYVDFTAQILTYSSNHRILSLASARPTEPADLDTRLPS